MLVKLTKTREKQLRRERNKQQRVSCPGYLPPPLKRAKRGLDFMRRQMRQGTLEKTPENAARARELLETVSFYGNTSDFAWVRPYFKDLQP